LITFAAKPGVGKVVLAGRVALAGRAALPAGSPVVLLAGSKKIGVAKLTKAGNYVFTAKLKKGSYSLLARVAAPEINDGTAGCTAIPPCPCAQLSPCVSSAIPAFTVASKVVKVNVSK